MADDTDNINASGVLAADRIFTSGAYAVTAATIDDDYGASNQTAPAIVPAGSISGKLDPAWDMDRFKISLQAGNYYTFTLAAKLPADNQYLALTVSNAAGDTLGYMNGVYKASSPSVTLRPSVSGDYYLNASNVPGYGTAPTPLAYTLSASLPMRDEYGETPATATTITLGVSVTGRLQHYTDTDMVKVFLTAGRTYGFTVKSPDNDQTIAANLSLSVLDAAGRPLASTLSYDLGYKSFTPKTNAYYYVSLARWEGDYALTVAAAADDYAANSATVGKLVVGDEIKGKLESGGGDRDWIAVNLVAGTTYWMSGNNLTGYINGQPMRLLDSGGTELAVLPHYDTLPYLATRTGTHYVEITSSSHTADDYTIAVKLGERDDHGDTAASASRLAFDMPLTGKLELNSDKDVFKLAVEAGSTYSLIPTLGTIPYVSIEVRDAANAVLFLQGWDSKGISGQLFTPDKSGEVSITISGAYAGTYGLGAIAHGVDDFRNDNITTGRLAVNTSAQGSLSTPLDRDWFAIAVEAGKSYVFDLLGAASSNGTLDAKGVEMVIIGPTYGHTPQQALTTGIEPRVAFVPATSDTYFIQLSGNGRMGSYTVRAAAPSSDAVGPALMAQSHAQGARDVPLVASRIELSFSESIAIDKAAIVLRNSIGDRIPLKYEAGTSSPYVIDNRLVVEAAQFLLPDTYTLSMPGQAVHDLTGNQHQGPRTLTFTTVLPQAGSTGGADLLAAPNGAALDGGAGIDTVFYPSASVGDLIDRNGDTTTVTRFGSGEAATDTLTNIERLLFGRQAIVLDIEGNGGQAYRLYQAAFDRTPDSAGLGFWISFLDKGMSLGEVGSFFVASPEFARLYGTGTTDRQFVEQLYQNILNRAGEPNGVDFWLDVLARGISRGDVLTGFSESPENTAAVASIIGEGFGYTL